MASTGKRFIGGHTRTVLSLAVTAASNVRIISGAENGELAIWTHDGSILHKNCIGKGDVTSVVCSCLNSDIFYASCENKIFGYDMRQMNMPICVFDSNGEEINQIVLNDNETYLGSANDSGSISIFNLTNMKLYKILKKHTNICASISFRPNRPLDLVSGAYDCNLIQWNFSKSRSFRVINLDELATAPEDLESYIVSPSFVHNLSISSSGNTLICGTENGLVHVFDSSRKVLHFKKTLRHHTQGVSQVHFLNSYSDKYVISGGNDRRICLWDLEQELSHGVAIVGQTSADRIQNPRFEIKHEEKINWLTTGAVNNNTFLAVADNTSSPIIFKLPA